MALAKTHPHLTHEQVRTAGRRNGSRHTPSRGKTEGRRGEREFATKRPKRVSLQFTPADPDAPYYPNPLPASPPRGVGVSLVQLNTSSTVAPHNSKRACERGQKCNAHAVPGSVLPHSLNDESRSPLYNKGPLRNKKRRPQWERTLTEREVPRVCSQHLRVAHSFMTVSRNARSPRGSSRPAGSLPPSPGPPDLNLSQTSA